MALASIFSSSFCSTLLQGASMVINTPIMENQMEKKMENDMETLGPFKGVYRV